MPNRLVEWLKFEEGFRALPYKCTAGFPTIGYGRNLAAHPVQGRDWRANPCTKEEAEGWLRDTLGDLLYILGRAKPVMAQLDSVRAAAILNMGYQLGLGGLLRFRRMWAALEQRKWIEAAQMARDSRWAAQTPNRARRICRAIETGEWPEEVVRSA